MFRCCRVRLKSFPDVVSPGSLLEIHNVRPPVQTCWTEPCILVAPLGGLCAWWRVRNIAEGDQMLPPNAALAEGLFLADSNWETVERGSALWPPSLCLKAEHKFTFVKVFPSPYQEEKDSGDCRYHQRQLDCSNNSTEQPLSTTYFLVTLPQFTASRSPKHHFFCLVISPQYISLF
jgi:hypothetical protein